MIAFTGVTAVLVTLLVAAVVVAGLAGLCLGMETAARWADRRRGLVRLRWWRALIPAWALRGKVPQDGQLTEWEQDRWAVIVERRRVRAAEPARGVRGRL